MNTTATKNKDAIELIKETLKSRTESAEYWFKVSLDNTEPILRRKNALIAYDHNLIRTVLLEDLLKELGEL